MDLKQKRQAMKGLSTPLSEGNPPSNEESVGKARGRYKAAAWTATANLVGRPLNLAMSLAIVGLAVRSLGPDRYGIWINCHTLALWFSVCECGVASSLLNRVARARAQEDKDAYLKTIATANTFLVLVGLGVFALVSLLAYFGPLPALLDPTGVVIKSETRACMVVFGAFAAALIPLQLYDRVALAHQEGWLNVIGQLTATAAALVMVAAAVGFNASLPVVAGAWVVGTLLGMMLVRAAIRRRYRERLAGAQAVFCRTEMKELLGAGFWFVVASFAGQLALQSDPLILTIAENLTGRPVGPSVATELAVPMRLFNVINAFAILAVNPLWPAYADATARGDTRWAYRTLVMSSAIAVATAVVAVTPCVLFGEQLLSLWVGDAVHVAPSLLTAYAAWTITMVSIHSLSVFCQGQGSGMLRLHSVTSAAFLIVAMPAKLLGLSIAGPTGLVIATTVAGLCAQMIPLIAAIGIGVAKNKSMQHVADNPGG
ncbi:MAG: lipopolysaccharide biosynthesis protein [Planctomycetia bacterium]